MVGPQLIQQWADGGGRGEREPTVGFRTKLSCCLALGLETLGSKVCEDLGHVLFGCLGM